VLIVADVAGKGVPPAALIMSALRASVHLFSTMNLSLEELMHRLNAQVYESTSAGSYVTLFLAEIDTVSNSITYVNAGHPPPILHWNGQTRLSRRRPSACSRSAQLSAATEDISGTTLVRTDGVGNAPARQSCWRARPQEFGWRMPFTMAWLCRRLSEQVSTGENRPLRTTPPRWPGCRGVVLVTEAQDHERPRLRWTA
jgi:hypothetical protein